jgi:hypothetical protein
MVIFGQWINEPYAYLFLIVKKIEKKLHVKFFWPTMTLLDHGLTNFAPTFQKYY